MWHKRKKTNTRRSKSNPCLYFWLQLVQAVSLQDETELCLHVRRGGGRRRRASTCTGSHKHPSTSLQPKTFFLILRCLQHHQCHAPVRQWKKKKNNAYSYSNANRLKKKYIFKQCNHNQESKMDMSAFFFLKCLRKTNHAFFSHVCSCSVSFFFFF